MISGCGVGTAETSQEQPDDIAGALVGRFVQDGGNHQWMEEEGSGVFESNGAFSGVDGRELAGVDAVLEEADEDPDNFRSPPRRHVGTDFDDAAVSFEHFGVFAQFLFSLAMEFEDNRGDTLRSGSGAAGDGFDEDLQFGEPFVDDGIEDFGFGPEKAVDIGVGHVEGAGDIHDGELIRAIAPKELAGGLEDKRASVSCACGGHIYLVEHMNRFDKPFKYTLHSLKLVTTESV